MDVVRSNHISLPDKQVMNVEASDEMSRLDKQVMIVEASTEECRGPNFSTAEPKEEWCHVPRSSQ